MVDNTNKAVRRKYHFIYKTTCILTGRYYIGMHSTDKLNDGYLGSGVRLRYSVKKHGTEKHVREILEDCSEHGRAYLRGRENVWIGEEQLKDPMCMNIVLGGYEPPNQLGRKFSEAHKRKLSISNKGKKRSKETCKRISLAGKGKHGGPLSLEHRKKLSEAKKGIKFTDRHKKNLSEAHKNHKHSKETKEKLSIIGRGRKLSEKQKKQIGDVHRGKKLSEATKQKIREKLLKFYKQQRQAKKPY